MLIKLRRNAIQRTLQHVIARTEEDRVTEEDDLIIQRATELIDLLNDNWNFEDFVEVKIP